MPKIVRSTDELITNNITGALLPASGTTGERPSVPVDGQIRYNTTTPGLETFVNGAWSTLAAASGLGSFVRRDGDTMVGTLTFTDGFQLIVDETGTVSAPAIAFDGDLDTGIYQFGGNIVGVTGQGANVALFDGSVATPVNYFTFASSATANAPIITNAGTDTNGVGLGLSIIGKTATAAGIGGQITITAGGGDTTGIGGAINFTGGLGGATSAGGTASLTGGAGQGTAAGGNTTIAGGTSGAGATGTGGEVHVHGGDSAATNGPGGQAHVHGGLGIGTDAGGLATIFGGIGGATGTGGAATLIGGASGGAGGTAGSVTIDAGALAGGTAGSVTIAGTDATTLTLGNTSFPVATTAIGILALTAANTLTAVNAATGGATFQLLQFNDSGDTFEWVDRQILIGFSNVTGDTGSGLAEFQDTLVLTGATNGGITTIAADNPEGVTFSITPIDLTTTGATIVGADFIVVSDSTDTATTIALKVTFTAALNDLGVPFTGGTEDAADYLHLDGSTIMTGVATMSDLGTLATPDLTWTGDLDTGLAQIGVADTLSVVAGAAEVAQFVGVVANVNFFTLSNSATGATPIFSNTGTDTNGIGLGLAFTAKAASAAGAGGPLTLTGGAGDTGGAGGAIDLIGGVSGATGTGGAISLTGGDSAGAGGTAGSVTIDAGALAGGAAGTVTIAGTDASTLTLGATSFPVGATAIGILALTAANTLGAVNATTGAATQQLLQFDDSGDTFSWVDKATLTGLDSYLLLVGGTLTGALVVDDAGTAATPDLAWTGDLDTGLAQIGVADTLSIIGGGVEIVQFIGTVADDNFLTISSSATGVTPVISNAGTDTNGIGLGIAITGKAASATGTGGPVVFTAGAGNDTGAGGAASLTGGVGGATGAGGTVDLLAGAGGATSGVGGQVNITAGAGIGDGLGAGGAIIFTTGASDAHTTGTASVGGAITFTAGQPGAATSGVGGLGGTISLLGATGGATSADTGLGGAGSDIVITGGAGGASDTGAASVGGAGGDVNITAGAGGSSTSGTGGLGANVIVTPGTAGEAGSGDGAIILATKEIPLIKRMADVVADSGASTSMTEAELFGGYHIKDPAGAISYQTPNGTEISAYFPGTPTVGDSFEWTLINSGNVTAENITLTTDTGTSFAGGATANILAPYADITTAIKHTQTWLVVNTGANTWLFIPK